jgi:hypothetical protein
VAQTECLRRWVEAATFPRIDEDRLPPPIAVAWKRSTMEREQDKPKLGKRSAFVKTQLSRLRQGDDTWEADIQAPKWWWCPWTVAKLTQGQDFRPFAARAPKNRRWDNPQKKLGF